MCRKVGQRIGVLRRSFRQLSAESRRLFLISVIQPDLEYAASVTVPTMSSQLRDRLVAVWRKAVRCAAGTRWQDELPPLLHQLRLTPILHCWFLQTATTIRRCHILCAPKPLCVKLLRTRHHFRTRGNNKSFRPILSKTTSGRISFSNSAPLLWNALDSEI